MDESQGYSWDQFKEDIGTMQRTNTAECPLCGGVGKEMGVLAEREWFRCQDCGFDFSRAFNPETTDVEDETELSQD